MEFYQRRRQQGDFLILDNSANEGFEYSPNQLLAMAQLVEANEIVVPDALGDLVGTLSRAKAFVPYAIPDMRYMAVLQGKDWDEVMKCLYFYDTAPDMHYITCIGIPRHLNKIEPQFRCELTEFIIANEFHTKFQFHYLGAGQWLREIATIASLVEGFETTNWDGPGFRGHDTSMPVYMALLRKTLAPGEWVTRPEGFFDMWPPSTGSSEEKLLYKNITAYLAWAAAPEPTDIPTG